VCTVQYMIKHCTQLWRECFLIVCLGLVSAQYCAHNVYSWGTETLVFSSVPEQTCAQAKLYTRGMLTLSLSQPYFSPLSILCVRLSSPSSLPISRHITSSTILRLLVLLYSGAVVSGAAFTVFGLFITAWWTEGVAVYTI
jgi:hypothetical protein